MTKLQFTSMEMERQRLKLTDEQMACYYGTPYTTMHKWLTGEREPATVVSRLTEILRLIEVAAPDLHLKLIMDCKIRAKSKTDKKKD